jgi:hypothetical protein
MTNRGGSKRLCLLQRHAQVRHDAASTHLAQVTTYTSRLASAKCALRDGFMRGRPRASDLRRASLRQLPHPQRLNCSVLVDAGDAPMIFDRYLAKMSV